VPPLHRLPLGRSADLSPSFSRRCDAPRGSDSVSYFRCVFGRFTFVHLLSSYLPASYGRFLQQSLTTMAFWATAALPGLKPASARRLRGACPHLLYSTGNPIRRLPVHVAPSRIFADTRRRLTELLRTTPGGWRGASVAGPVLWVWATPCPRYTGIESQDSVHGGSCRDVLTTGRPRQL
jgi:hypothetical protein